MTTTPYITNVLRGAIASATDEELQRVLAGFSTKSDMILKVRERFILTYTQELERR